MLLINCFAFWKFCLPLAIVRAIVIVFAGCVGCVGAMVVVARSMCFSRLFGVLFVGSFIDAPFSRWREGGRIY